jgi:hypothetical protein
VQSFGFMTAGMTKAKSYAFEKTAFDILAQEPNAAMGLFKVVKCFL